MKKVLAALITALMVAFSFSGGLALAQKIDGIDQEGLSREDRAAYDSMWQAHRQAVAPIQDQFWAKSMEYEALTANPNTKLSDIRPVIDEMAKLRGQMRVEHDKFMAQLGNKGYGPAGGYGPGNCGGMGYGRGMGGYGYGKHHRGNSYDRW